MDNSMRMKLLPNLNSFVNLYSIRISSLVPCPSECEYGVNDGMSCFVLSED